MPHAGVWSHSITALVVSWRVIYTVWFLPELLQLYAGKFLARSAAGQ